MHIVTLNHLGNTFFLRSTIWTAQRERATEFETAEAAKEGLNKAKNFMKASQYKAAKIEPA